MIPQYWTVKPQYSLPRHEVEFKAKIYFCWSIEQKVSPRTLPSECEMFKRKWSCNQPSHI